jgi:chemotaxis protein MotB
MTLLLIFFLFFYTTAVKGSSSAPQDLAHIGAPVRVETSAPPQEKVETTIPADSDRPPAAASLMEEDNEKPETTMGQIDIEALKPVEEFTGQLRDETPEAPAEAIKDFHDADPDTSEQTIEQFREEIVETMDSKDRDLFSVSSDRQRLVFVLGERITFEEGDATLLESYHPIFVRISDFIASKPEYQVVVSGHTDNKPIRTEKFPSNLELSSVRAITVARFLIENGVSPRRVSIQGFSQYRPLVANDSPGNRQKNRRVEIALIKDQDNRRPGPAIKSIGN